ncbi:MAG: hypothetical protein JSR09_03685 [Bacteroidetes bacterium]|nr:hypothetical protein [Bacteroidota bacterium]MBS1648785.1 hypothetical protein [Bacteroidota bacterium]
MKKIIFFSYIVICAGIIVSCHHKVQQATPVRRDTFPTVKEPDVYIPFTKELYNILKNSNIDVRKVQFYIDQQVVLTRNLTQGKTEVVNGVIKFSNGHYVDEVIIQQHTPCVVDSVDYDGFRVSFGGAANWFKFINSRQSTYPDNYVCSGTNWKDGTADLLYNKLVYRGSCGTCGSLADVRLEVKQSDFDNSTRKTTVLPGRRVGN